MASQDIRTAYGRRGYALDPYGRSLETTFVSRDEADEQPIGWFRGWVADGHVWDGLQITHVKTPSWRVAEPVMLAERRAA